MASAPVRRFVVIATTAFLTLVDLFAAQAILPMLTRAYGVSPASMGFAVNATTIGMAIGGLSVGLFGARINRRVGIFVALATLTVPTLLLSTLPVLAVFTVLRIIQGFCMAAAFALTLAYLGETAGESDSASAFAAYITGNVASNLIGRLISAGVADHFGLTVTFLVFAALNLLGALLVFLTIHQTSRPAAAMMDIDMGMGRSMATWAVLLRDSRLVAGFGIGFCILFAFIGTFSFVNFVLARPPLSLGMMQIGLVYFVFLPSMAMTPLAGAVAYRFGTRTTMGAGLLLALCGLPLLILPDLKAVLAGMVLVATGTFFAQAIATGFVNRAAGCNKGAASGIYLASYCTGGLAGSVILGQIFDRLGWTACVIGIGCAVLIATALAVQLRDDAHLTVPSMPTEASGCP